MRPVGSYNETPSVVYDNLFSVFFFFFFVARESSLTSMRSVLSFLAICVDHVHYRVI